MHTRLRPATSADTDGIRRLVDEAYAVYVPRIGRKPAPMTADHGALIAAGAVTVAEMDGDVVGVLVTHPEPDHLLVENVAVAPRCQGHGLGRLLLDHAEAQARELGLPELRLYTNQAMTENLAMYPRLGYVEAGRNVEHGFARVHFRKPVSQM
ncbi:MAG: GNAT family N-acetyltransferase [Gaiellales bacterium]